MFELYILCSDENCKLLSGSSQFLFLLSLPKQNTHILYCTHTVSFDAHVVATSQALNYLLHCKLCFRYCAVVSFFLLLSTRTRECRVRKKLHKKKITTTSQKIWYLFWTKNSFASQKWEWATIKCFGLKRSVKLFFTFLHSLSILGMWNERIFNKIHYMYSWYNIY